MHLISYFVPNASPMLLAFPEFNLYGTPLLILVIQGLIFGLLLVYRYYRQHHLSDLLLGLLVLITCYHRTTYTIGFMGWYDTYRTTKINYWLIPLTLSFGPLIYLYMRSITTSRQKISGRDWLHFLPVFLFIAYRLGIFLFDATQPGFKDTQNGVLMQAWEIGLVGPLISTVEILQLTLYLGFTFQLYYNYLKKIPDYYSNTYQMELRWMRNFLYIYSFLFLYGVFQGVVDRSIMELSWVQKWWNDFLSALAVIYIGVMGYFTNTRQLQRIGENPPVLPDLKGMPVLSEDGRPRTYREEIPEDRKNELLSYMKKQQSYLDPELNLKDLAASLQMSRSQLSEIINYGFGKNFNDFINSYRIEHFKQLLRQGRQEHLSLLGLAFESGFNSKATFNRVFRKYTGQSPSEYLNSTP